ncbi:hypothetical protein GTP41_23205 [Pseudoduganella sp. DS3]|uniref:DUF3649 domain-containing protein n=1 Tax=Pseudoduganella guangdongensis TaxID=2692179 RepID=A0A6N9HMW8_9BURK|nr:hypothetical protein [Pseudoduganella guangdongensis]MYN05008.1 hypothetical protein [Pseudoduganella guangdongensis]
MLGKASAAAFLGMPLAAGMVGILILLLRDQRSWTLPLLLLFFLVWVAVMAAAFQCRSGWRAWLWMGSATAGVYGSMYLLKASGLARVAA